MRPLFIIEEERQVRGAAQHEGSTRNLHITRKRPDDLQRGRSASESNPGARIGERLPSVGDRLPVHVLVIEGELVKVDLILVELVGAQPFNDAIKHALHEAEGLLA